MKMKVLVAHFPRSDLLVLVSGVIVKYDVNVQPIGDVALDLIQEAKELLMPMPVLAGNLNVSGGNVQCGEEGCYSMPYVVVGNALGVSDSHGQDGLGTLPG